MPFLVFTVLERMTTGLEVPVVVAVEDEAVLEVEPVAELPVPIAAFMSLEEFIADELVSLEEFIADEFISLDELVSDDEFTSLDEFMSDDELVSLDEFVSVDEFVSDDELVSEDEFVSDEVFDEESVLLLIEVIAGSEAEFVSVLLRLLSR